jgi:hypothetical protein
VLRSSIELFFSVYRTEEIRKAIYQQLKAKQTCFTTKREDSKKKKIDGEKKKKKN